MPISIFGILGITCPSDCSVSVHRKAYEYRRYTSTGTLAVSKHKESSKIASQHCFGNSFDSICKISLAELFCFLCYRVAKCSKLDKENFSNDLSPHQCIEDIVFIILYYSIFLVVPALN